MLGCSTSRGKPFKRTVDFDYEDKKEIIWVEEDSEVKEVRTDNYIFENIWQPFRTNKN